MEGEPGNSEISFLTIPSHSKHLMSSGREFQSVNALLKDLNEKKNGNTSFENNSDETENLSVSDDEINLRKTDHSKRNPRTYIET